MDVKHGIDEGEEEEESLGPFSSLSESSRGSSSLSFELTEDTASSGSSSSSSSPTSSCKGPLFAMSSIKEQLPFKRGLSKYYEGKSQSFTSLSNVSCLEDLVKPERPPKRLKSSTSNKKALTKKASKGCFSSSNVSARRNCLLLGSKPPLYPHRNGNLSDQTLWFA